MKELQKGKHTFLLDDEDYDLIMDMIGEGCQLKVDHQYQLNIKIDGIHNRVSRFVMCVHATDNIVFLDGNVKNLQKSNLDVRCRSVTYMNSVSVRGRGEKTSKYRGVSLVVKRNKKRGYESRYWLANLKRKGERILHKYFDDEIEAAKAYDEVARRVYGEYARLNFPE